MEEEQKNNYNAVFPVSSARTNDPVAGSDSPAVQVIPEVPDSAPRSCLMREQWTVLNLFTVTRADAISLFILVVAWFLIIFLALVSSPWLSCDR